MKYGRPVRQRRFPILFAFISCIILAFAGRHALVGFLATRVFQHFYPAEQGAIIHYDSAKWNGRILSVSGVEIETPIERVQIEKIELNLGLTPHLWLIRPNLTIKETPSQENDKKKMHGLFFLLRLVRFDVVEGKCTIMPSIEHLAEKSFNFSLESLENDAPNMRLVCSKDSEVLEGPFFESFFCLYKDHMDIEAYSKAASMEELLAFAHLFLPRFCEELETVQGICDADMQLTVDKNGQLLAMQGTLSASGVILENNIKGWQIGANAFEMAIHASKKKGAKFLETEAAISGGRFHLLDSQNEYRFVDLAGYITWLKEKDPKFHLEGQLILGKTTESVCIDGNGSIDEQEGLRIDSQFSLGEKTQLIASGTMSIVSKLEEIAIDVGLQQAELAFLKHLSDIIGWTSPLQFSVQGGLLQGSGLFKFRDGELVKTELAPLHLIDASFGNNDAFDMNGLTLSIEGKWHVLPEIGWQIKRCKGVIQSGSIEFKQLNNLCVDHLSGECYIERGQIEESIFKAQIMDVPIELELSENWSHPSGILYASTNWNRFVDILSSCGVPLQNGHQFKEGVEIVCEFKPQCRGYAGHFQVLAGSQGMAKSQILFVDQAIQQGTLRISQFPLPLLAGIISREFEGRGWVDAEGNFDAKGGSARFSLKEGNLESPKWAFETSSEMMGDFVWSAERKDAKIQLPLRSARFTLKEPNFVLDHLSGLLIATRRLTEIKEIEAMCCGILFKGDASIKDDNIKITSKEIRGDLCDLQSILSMFPKLSRITHGIQGKFAIKEQDLKLEWPSGAVFLRASLENVSLHHDIGTLDSISTKVLYNSQKGILCFDAIQGDLIIKEAMPLRIELQPIELRMNANEMAGVIAGSIKSGTCTCFDAFGHLRISPHEKVLQFDPSKSVLFGRPLEKAFVQIKDQGINLYLSGSSDFATLLPLITQLQRKTSLPSQPLSLEGNCSYQIAWDSEAMKWQGSLQSNEISFNGAKLKRVSVRASKDPQRFCLEEVTWDDFKGYGEMTIDQSGNLPFVYHLSHCFLKSSGEGTINPSKKIVHVRPSLEISSLGHLITMKPEKSIALDFSQKGEIMVKEAKWEEPVTRSWMEFPKIRWCYGLGRLEIETLNFKISSLMTKKWLPDLCTSSGWFEGSSRCHRSSTGYEIEGTLRDGGYGWGKWQIKGKAIQFRWIPDHLLLGMKTYLGEAVLIGTAQLDFRDRLALLKVQKQGKDTPLSALLRLREQNILTVEKLSGECFGIRTDLKASQSRQHSLVGKVDIDFAELISSLPPKSKESLAKLKLGKGFSFEGEIHIPNWQDWKAEGRLKGKECVLFHMIFDHFESEVMVSPRQQIIKQMVLKEAGLSVTIPQMKLETPKEGGWTLHCPLLQINDLHPSRLRKLEEKEKKIKPFVIRNLTLSNVFGELNSMNSFKGDCLLQFTNEQKKESSFFDIPLNLLKDLGLEPTLLIPLHGELIGHLENGRLSFTELKGAYSEGRRTHFILASQGNGSYIDFDGRLHIDLLMKQAVVLKIGESLTLGIRGTIEKPRYLLLP